MVFFSHAVLKWPKEPENLETSQRQQRKICQNHEPIDTVRRKQAGTKRAIMGSFINYVGGCTAKFKHT